MFEKTTFVVCLAVALPLVSEDKFTARLNEYTAVLTTIVTKQNISKSTLDKAVCVIVYPSVKRVGVGIGVTYGRGVLSCRQGKEMDGKWSPPAMYTLDVGSLGAQLGSTSTDYVLLVMTQRGGEKVLSGKLKLGADASAVAGSAGAKAVGTMTPMSTYSPTLRRKDYLPGLRLAAPRLPQATTRTRRCMGKI